MPVYPVSQPRAHHNAAHNATLHGIVFWLCYSGTPALGCILRSLITRCHYSSSSSSAEAEAASLDRCMARSKSRNNTPPQSSELFWGDTGPLLLFHSDMCETLTIKQKKKRSWFNLFMEWHSIHIRCDSIWYDFYLIGLDWIIKLFSWWFQFRVWEFQSENVDI